MYPYYCSTKKKNTRPDHQASITWLSARCITHQQLPLARSLARSLMLPRAGTRVVRPLPLGVRVAAPALLIVLLLVAEATLVAYSPSAFDVPQRRRPLETRDEALQVQAFNDALEAGRVLASGTGAKRIVIAMSTVPRVLSAQPHHQQQQVQYADYLMSSLEALVPQLPQYGNVRAASLVSVAAVPTLLIEPTHPIQLKVDVQVVVMNHVAGNHSVFEQARDRYASHAQVHWIENRARRLDPHAELPEPEDANNHANLPGKKVRQQTLDLVSLLHASLERFQASGDDASTTEPIEQYLLLLEDDFPLCKAALQTINYAIHKVRQLQ